MISLLLAALISVQQPPVHIQADSSTYNAVTRKFLLEGNVVVTREAPEPPPDDLVHDNSVLAETSVTLRADLIEGKLDGIVEATGNVSVERGNIKAIATSGEYDLATSTGRFEHVSVQHESWFVSAARIALEGPDDYVVEDARLTSCNRTPPHYYFQSRRMRYSDGRLQMWGPRVVIGHVPVLWLPYLAVTPAGGAPTPFHLQAGKSGYEGFFGKLSYVYSAGFLGDGAIKLDYRSKRGWAYGLENTVGFRGGNMFTDLYRVEERDRSPRGLARVKYIQDWTDRWRGLAEIYKVSDGEFLEDYRFRTFVSNPDPQTTASASWRGDATAGMLRVVTNLNRPSYDLVERLPELRLMALPRPVPGAHGVLVEASGGVTEFRASHPYDSGPAALFAHDHPGENSLQNFLRGDAAFQARRPTPLGRHWMLTPYAGSDFVGYTEDSVGIGGSYRLMPYVGTTLANFYTLALSRTMSYSLRPVLDFRDRSLHGDRPERTPVIEHIDEERDGRPLHLILDQGLIERSGGGWSERLRLRLDGGYDFDRKRGDHYLPVVAKLVTVFGDANHGAGQSRFDGSLTYDPNRDSMRDARAELSYQQGKFKGAASYYYRRGDAGLRNFENVAGSLEAPFGATWSGSIGLSYDIEKNRLDFARYGLTKVLHDFVIYLEATDDRPRHRTKVEVSVEFKMP